MSTSVVRPAQTYIDTDLINVTVPIAHLGWAAWLRLVVAGPPAGQVWTDDPDSYKVSGPVSPTSFTDRDTAWLGVREAAVSSWGGLRHTAASGPS